MKVMKVMEVIKGRGKERYNLALFCPLAYITSVTYITFITSFGIPNPKLHVPVAARVFRSG
jgi:hypothetical protein